MYLYNHQRTARAPWSGTFSVASPPTLVAELRLPQYPAHGPESMVLVTPCGDLVFGCHDGTIYSFSSAGVMQWAFATPHKVYATPADVGNGSFVVSAGAGYLLAIKYCGSLAWAVDLGAPFSERRGLKRVLSNIAEVPFCIDVPRRRLIQTRAWGSPAILDQLVLATGWGAGLHAIDAYTGRTIWVGNLGWPRYHRASVAVSEDGENIFVQSQTARLTCFSRDGVRKWEKRVAPLGFQSWGTTSVSETSGKVFSTWGRGERSGYVVASDYSGDVLWRRSLVGAIRGGVAVAGDGRLFVATLAGYVIELCERTGKVVRQRRITQASRGLWTTPVLLGDYVLLGTKDGPCSGRLVCLDANLGDCWEIDVGKTLSPPTVTDRGAVLVGSWDGSMKIYRFQDLGSL